MPRVFLVNPAVTEFGFGLITPRWLFVLAQATPADIVGDPILIDESIKKFDTSLVKGGDIVGIGITTGNCAVGYKIIKELKNIGAQVIVGGIHATIFPDEPIQFGADSVITGNGEIAWPRAIQDALDKKLKKTYIGGRVPGNQLLPARWDLMDPSNYMAASVQTIAGCPENCNFCSVWVTDGRSPRQRLTDKIIGEVNQLYSMGFRYLLFADDNFNPGTLGRIAREENSVKKAQLERIREERLIFFEEYSRSVPEDIYAFTQMTSEITSDPEYLNAMYEKMRIRGVLMGVESFSEAGLKSANKQWNPSGDNMINAIGTIQDRGITVLSSMIYGLESDTESSLQSARNFAVQSGTDLAQFIIYSPYPGTVDFARMTDPRNPNKKISLLYNNFWLNPEKPPVLIKHPNLDGPTIIKEVKESWSHFYSIKKILTRALNHDWNLSKRTWYILFSLAFKFVYVIDGISADSVRSRRPTKLPFFLIKKGVALHRFLARRTVMQN